MPIEKQERYYFYESKLKGEKLFWQNGYLHPLISTHV
jgi:hypothetical protein